MFDQAPESASPLSTLVVETTIGPLRLVATQEALVGVQFHPFGEWEAAEAVAGEHSVLMSAAEQLRAYFAGELREFDLPLAPRGTEYQMRVWEALVAVPYGSTASYSEIARALGQPPGASRAVGLANGRNPIPVVIPCHRIIGANGSLTGYAGGLERKQVLLDLERGDAASERLF